MPYASHSSDSVTQFKHMHMLCMPRCSCVSRSARQALQTAYTVISLHYIFTNFLMLSLMGPDGDPSDGGLNACTSPTISKGQSACSSAQVCISMQPTQGQHHCHGEDCHSVLSKIKWQ